MRSKRLQRGATIVEAIIAMGVLVIGAAGMATYGYVAARDWGCKTGAFEKGCPAVRATPQRSDIPA